MTLGNKENVLNYPLYRMTFLTGVLCFIGLLYLYQLCIILSISYADLLASGGSDPIITNCALVGFLLFLNLGYYNIYKITNVQKMKNSILVNFIFTTVHAIACGFLAESYSFRFLTIYPAVLAITFFILSGLTYLPLKFDLTTRFGYKLFLNISTLLIASYNFLFLDFDSVDNLTRQSLDALVVIIFIGTWLLYGSLSLQSLKRLDINPSDFASGTWLLYSWPLAKYVID